jgi:hypothetical protein
MFQHDVPFQSITTIQQQVTTSTDSLHQTAAISQTEGTANISSSQQLRTTGTDNLHQTTTLSQTKLKF